MKKLAYFIVVVVLSLSFQVAAKAIDKASVYALSLPSSGELNNPFEGDFSQQIKQHLVTHLHSLPLDSGKVDVWGQQAQWQSLDALNGDTNAGVIVFGFDVSTDRFTKAALSIRGIEGSTLYINGLEHAGSDNTYELALANDEHRLMLISHGVASWDDVEFTWEASNKDANTAFSWPTSGKRLSAKQMYDSQTIGNLHMSPDGKHMVWTKTHYSDAEGDMPISMTELIEVSTQKVLYRWQGMQPSNLSWHPDNSQVIFLHKGTLFALRRDSLALQTIAEGMTGASNFMWLDDGTVVFSWWRPDESEDVKAKRYLALEDRWSYWRNSTQIYQLDIHSGFIRPLTQGDVSHELADVDAKRNKLVATRSLIDYQKPPHFAVDVVEIDIKSGESQVLTTHHGNINQVLYAGNGFHLIAGPTFADRVGSTLAGDVLDNEYDGQLFHLSSEGEVSALSVSFDPSIASAISLSKDDLLVTAVDQDRRQLFLFDSSKGTFTKLKNDLDVISQVSASAQKRPMIVMSGTTATKPQKIVLQKLNKKAKVLIDSAKTEYSNTAFSQVQDWDFTNANGEVIDGRFYLPPVFDANKKYPMIVYYYGGTTPVTRSFTGRWPFSLWAAKGYVVYIMQPAGTIGYGQDFSSKHVNAWGLQTAEDIMSSTKAFLKAHPFVDATKVANMGASYGGFMTMYLSTKTDLFAASISHAGISNLSEYWGYGWWGYAYSGIATRGKFPWNATAFYTQQSPLFQADKITTPMLLIHGDSDTNVPVSQSHQMYTALKILGKDVELVEFIGEDHTINSRERRLAWWDTILSYLDYKLKGQPLWWETLYPEQ